MRDDQIYVQVKIGKVNDRPMLEVDFPNLKESLGTVDGAKRELFKKSILAEFASLAVGVVDAMDRLLTGSWKLRGEDGTEV